MTDEREKTEGETSASAAHSPGGRAPAGRAKEGALAPGEGVGPYRIVGLLGAGGMGEVYRARDPRLEREVAVKVLPAEVAQDADRLGRFRREAKATSAMNHPNILSVYDTGTHEGHPYVVMELLEGETLRERLRAAGLPLRKALPYAAQIARGLGAAHEKGIVHRDLKPENVFITQDGQAKILDFGLARLTRPGLGSDADTATATTPGMVMGTVGYMSPEQVKGQAADHRSDIFAFGVLLFEMLAGRRPFGGKTAIETMNAILSQDPPDLAASDPSISPALDQLIQRCLDKRPSERLQSARDVAFHLETLAAPGTGRTVGPVKAAAPSRRRPLQVIVAAALLGGVAGAWFWGRSQGSTFVDPPTFHQVTFRRGKLHRARFGPDAQTIVYAAAWGKAGPMTQIYAGRLDRPDTRRLGITGYMHDVSSKGEVLLSQMALGRIPLEGGTPRWLMEGVGDAAWAPDGEEMAIVRGRDPTRVELPAGTVLYESVHALDEICVSPAGDKVAFIERNGNGRSLVVVDRRSSKTVLVEGWHRLTRIAWAPLGDAVWFTGSRVPGEPEGLCAVSLAGGLRTLLRVPGMMLLEDIAPDGRVLLTVDHLRGETRARLAGDERERGYSWLGLGWVADLTPKGDLLLFTEGDLAGTSWGAYLWRAGDETPVRLSDGTALALSPDSKWALVREAGSAQLLLVPTGPGEPRSLQHEGLRPYGRARFVPRGNSIVTAATDASGRNQTYLVSLEAGYRAVGGEGTEPRAVSPDGVWFVGHDPWVRFSLGGSDPRQVPQKDCWPRCTPGGWSANGASLFCLHHPDTEAYVAIGEIDLETGRCARSRELDMRDVAGLSGCQEFVVTPDGAHYAYSCLRALSTLYVVEGLR